MRAQAEGDLREDRESIYNVIKIRARENEIKERIEIELCICMSSHTRTSSFKVERNAKNEWKESVLCAGVFMDRSIFEICT